MKNVPLTEAALQGCCQEWQKILRLQDWDIEARFVRSRDLVSEDSVSWGAIRINQEHKRAEMAVLHPDDYDPPDKIGEIESTIVHELLHICLDQLTNGDSEAFDEKNHLAVEQICNLWSEAFVNLKRLAERE